ncbi:uncharacterized protein C8A04DRAFT_13449 [Dichotomopilus funicola]|uniref:LYR motif-containing protein Cup1-like N-terminal domain-containing protein n=1 Tax=Dichotomopilus funicola TaxID=1934379 RepID=A0AAN6ZLE9_9PEZI|nr:hypothetical protein C8A04DRAFT_13449 [Dichotomopilus funicola]
MSRPLRLPRPETPIHLYRHILRESSYLPRPARWVIDERIKARFRAGIDSWADDELIARRIRHAHHGLRLIRAANAGDMDRMRRIMYFAIGRRGPRRRELVARLVSFDKPSSTADLERFISKAHAVDEKDRKLDWLDTWDVEKLRVFARSQANAGINSPRASIMAHQTSPEKRIPAENSWGRPLPLKLARSKLLALWRKLAEKIMPPLPVSEWKRLRNIIQGTVQAQWLPPPRRALAKGILEVVPPARNWDWKAYAVKPVAAVDRQANRRNKLLSGALDDNSPSDPQPTGCHKYKPRSFRRMLAEVWRLSATMKQKPTGKGWDITWGRETMLPASPMGRSLEFFKDYPDPEGGNKNRKQPPRRGKHRGAAKRS